MGEIFHCGTQNIDTKRLILRRFLITDADDMYANVCSDSRVNRYLTWKVHNSIDDTIELMKSFVARYESDSRYCWAIVEKETNQVIGTIAAPTVKEKTKTIEITYAIGFDWWGKGITAEAVNAVIDFFFEKVGINRIEAGHDLLNVNSGKVMQKVGMQKEGVLRQAGINNTGVFDIVLYSILKEEWEAN